MGADASQNAGKLALGFRRGETYSEVIDVSLDMTGYAVASDLVSLVTGGVVASMATTLVDAAAGKVGVTLTSSQTAALAPGTYGWRQMWTAPGGVSREGLRGFVEVRP
jgi:hypothetical protein